MFRNNFMCVLMYDYPSVCVFEYNYCRKEGDTYCMTYIEKKVAQQHTREA